MKIGVDAQEFIEKGKTGISRYLENLLTPLIHGAGIGILKKDGVIAIAVPNAGSLVGRLAREKWLGFAAEEHLCHYTVVMSQKENICQS